MDNVEKITQDDLNERVRLSKIVQPLGAASNLTNELDKQLKPKYPEPSKNMPRKTDQPFTELFDDELSKITDDPETTKRDYAAFKSQKDAAFLQQLKNRKRS